MDASSPAFDFFISRRGTVAREAQEVAGILTDAGYRVTVQDYDSTQGSVFPLFIHDALKAAQHLLLLHTADYDTNRWTREEFGHFLAQSRQPGQARDIRLLRCDGSQPEGLLAGLVRGTLHGVTEPQQRRRIILAAARGEAAATHGGTPIFGPPGMPRENLLFTGPDDLLVALHAALSGGSGRAALTQAAVYGLGGVGKTSLARAYVARFGAVYGGVWWIAGTDRAGITTGLGDLAHALDPRLPADLAPNTAAAAALRLLGDRGGPPFLLVYDNVASPETLGDLVPARGAHVLVTSRAADWGGVAAELAVPALTEDAAVEFLQRRADVDDAVGALALARALGCLPLALDHAGAYVKLAASSFDSYARRLDALLHLSPPRGAAYPASVAATFALAIDAAAGECAAAETLLGTFAWLDPDAVPLALGDAKVLPEEERDAAMMALRAVSLLSPAPTGACGPAVSVHRLVQAVMRARLVTRGEADAARDRAVAALDRCFPEGAYRNPALWPPCRVLLPHLRTVLDHSSGHASAALANLLDKAGSFLDGSGASAAAEAFFRRARALRELVQGPEHPLTLGSVNNLALCLKSQGKLGAAEPLYRDVLEVQERVLGPWHPGTLNGMNNLAACLHAMGDFEAAKQLHRRALDAKEHVLGPTHPDTLSSVNNLANCFQAMGEVEAAKRLHGRALEGRERLLGPEHSDTLQSANNLAACLQAKGDFDAAEPLLRRALEGREHVLGPQHPATLISMSNLAFCLNRKGEFYAAELLYGRAIEALERVLGPEHRETLTSVNNLALCLQAKGELDAAEAIYRRVLEATERMRGPEHPDTLVSMNNLAFCLDVKGEFDEPALLYGRALAGAERVLGLDHPDTMLFRNNLAALNAKRAG